MSHVLTNDELHRLENVPTQDLSRDQLLSIIFTVRAERDIHRDNARMLRAAHDSVFAERDRLREAARSLLWLFDGNSSVSEKQQALQSLRAALSPGTHHPEPPETACGCPNQAPGMAHLLGCPEAETPERCPNEGCFEGIIMSDYGHPEGRCIWPGHTSPPPQTEPISPLETRADWYKAPAAPSTEEGAPDATSERRS